MRSRNFTTCVARMAAGIAGIGLILAASTAIAQQHHPPQDQAIHQRFYSTWMMPGNRKLTCCDDKDCGPAESKLENGHWIARKINDSYWFNIPPEAVEHERVSPDGRSHLCGERWFGYLDKVYCFIPGVAF